MKNLGEFERISSVPVELDQPSEEEAKVLESPVSSLVSVGQEAALKSISDHNEIDGDDFIKKSKKAVEVAVEYGERAVDFLKYKSLKVKEYFGLINQEELDLLLLIDFEQELADNAPIEGVFSPEDEINKIRSLPREQKRDALESLKSRTERQRQAWAMCRVFIERRIEANHDVSKDVLMAEVERFGSRYGFGDQKQIAEELIDCYYAKREKARELREQYPDNTELVSVLTGEEFDKPQKFDIFLGPMSIDVEADHLNTIKLNGNSSLKWYSLLGGFAATSQCDSSVYYTVLNRSLFVKMVSLSTLSNTRKHEWEHQKNRIFRNFFEQKLISADEQTFSVKEYESELDKELKKVILAGLFNDLLNKQLSVVKDELLARFQSESFTAVNKELFNLFGYDGAYNFVKRVVNDESKKDDELWQKYALEILEFDCKYIIGRAMRAYGRLVAVKQNDFDRVNGGKQREFTAQEAIALLTDKPLKEWPKTVRRFLGQKKIDRIVAKNADVLD